MQKIVIIGAGGHSKSVIDTITMKKEYEIAGIVDKTNRQQIFKEYTIIGDDNMLEDIFQSGVQNAFVAIGFLGKSSVRESLYNRLRNIGFRLPVIIDDTAKVAEKVFVGEGTFIGKGCIVNADSHIGKMCIINTGAIIEHECHIDDYTHVAVGAVLCGGVHVGSKTLIGSNATLIQDLKIGKNCIVGAGTIVTKNMGDGEMRYGNKCVKKEESKTVV